MQQQPWWKDAVIYHIYPRSFRDANGDGMGDLEGITERLDHIRALGADAIWMGPVFRSPQVDNGYDICDYRAIDPIFGTLEEMDRLLERAHAKGIRVLLDLVFNHTSNEHDWFRESLRDPQGPYGDYYIWRDPAEDGGPPNNWRSFFSVPAWTYAPERKQYYLHLFAPEQPDLNWENPRVREELAEVANFWLHRGVDGFRLDVINVISKRPGLPSMVNGVRSGLYIDGPKVLPYLQEFRSRLKRKDALLVGETPGVTPEAARRYTLPENRALDMVLIFDHVMLDHGPGGRWDPRPLRISKLREVLADWQGTLGEPAWPSIYLSNHDQPRVVSRYGDDGRYRYESATALATIFFLQRGTPIVYQGDEIAMANYPIRRVEEIVDIESRNAYTHLVHEEGVSPEAAFERVRSNARDNGRTPMQWDNTSHAGFTDGQNEPWYPPNPDFLEVNAAAEDQCPGNSEPVPLPPGSEVPPTVLCYYRRLFALRRNSTALLRGAFAPLAFSEASTVAAYVRRRSEEQILVVANLSGEEAAWEPPQGSATLLLGNYPEASPETSRTLRPWECRVLRQEI
jgi:oligo-1,6-glucosidase